MEIKISTKDLEGKSLMVATPMYGGMCAGMFCKSTNDLSTAFTKYGIPLQYYYLFNESLITRARNYCVDEFLRSDNTHLLFIDSDIGFNFKDVITLLHLCGRDGYDIITGPYPKKTIAWEKIKSAVDQGFADENPFQLDEFVGDYVFNPAEGISSFRIDEPVEIKEGGTGFMMISRESLEKYQEAYPELRYRPDHIRTDNFDGTREITAFFDTIIDPDSKRYLSEDYMFSKYARDIGLKIWMCPWMKLKHVGTYIFGGSMAAMAAIKASPTASLGSNKKHYEKPKPENFDLTIDKDDGNIGLSRQQRRAEKRKNKKGNT